MQYRHYLMAFSILWSSNVSAITLQEALTLAYKNSEQLKIAQENFMGEIEAMPQAISGFMPKISAGISLDDTKTTSTSGRSVPGSRSISDTSRNINLKQNLFSGGSDVAAVKSAQSAYRASRAKLYSAEQKILLEALEAYMAFYEAKETYDVRKVSVEFNSNQLEATEARFKLGEATRTDVAQAHAAFLKAESDQAIAFANLEAAKALFQKTFATDPVDIALPDAPGDLPENLDALMSKTSVSNLDVAQAKHSLASSKANAVSATGALLPSADFTAKLSQVYYNPESSANAQGSNANNNQRTFTTSVGVTIPILSSGGAEYSKIRKAKSEARRSAHQVAEATNAVKASAIGSFAGYQASNVAISSADQAVKAYELTLEGVTQEYNVGSKVISDVLKAEEDFSATKIQSIRAKKQMITSAYQMKASMGEMTAVSLKLPVKYFNPGTEFRKVKGKIVGF
jgi:outer membrane protein